MSKLTAILHRPNTEPVQVEITDVDGEAWTAIVETPIGIELFVSVSDLHGIEYQDETGNRKFLGEPKKI